MIPNGCNIRNWYLFASIIEQKTIKYKNVGPFFIAICYFLGSKLDGPYVMDDDDDQRQRPRPSLPSSDLHVFEIV